MAVGVAVASASTWAAIGLRRRACDESTHTDFGQLLDDNIGDLTGGAAQPIDIRVYGDDQGLLEQKARAIAKLIAGVRGVTDVFDGIVIAELVQPLAIGVIGGFVISGPLVLVVLPGLFHLLDPRGRLGRT